MKSDIGLIVMGLVAIFATSMSKVVALAAIAWGAWSAYKNWQAM